MKQFFVLFLIILLSTIALQGAEEFSRTGQWKHDDVFGREFFSFIDNDNHLAGGYYRIGCRLVTPDNIVKFAPRGQGPGDLITFSAGFPYKKEVHCGSIRHSNYDGKGRRSIKWNS